MHMNELTLCMWYQHHPMELTHDRSNIIQIRPCQHRFHTIGIMPFTDPTPLMDIVSSMSMNECNIYNILIPSSSSSYHHHHQVCSYILTSFNHHSIIIT